MEYELKYQCQECEGFGKIEHQRSETLFSVSPCPECDGEAFTTVHETYDSIQDLRADYPDAMVKEMKGDNTTCDCCGNVFDVRNSPHEVIDDKWICNKCCSTYDDEELRERIND